MRFQKLDVMGDVPSKKSKTNLKHHRYHSPWYSLHPNEMPFHLSSKEKGSGSASWQNILTLLERCLGESDCLGHWKSSQAPFFRGDIPVSFREGRKNPSTHGIGIVMIDMIKYQ